MVSIVTQFQLNLSEHSLNIECDDGQQLALSYEYLRVFSPKEIQAVKGGVPQVFHKKSVRLLNIESVGKHGFRFIFDDNHQDIYSHEHLLQLGRESQQRWSHYLETVKQSIQSRDAEINFKQVT